MSRNLYQSEFHRHADCLKPIKGGIRLVPNGEGDHEVPEPGWVECSRNRVRYHRHGSGLMAHFSGDRRACPTGVTA